MPPKKQKQPKTAPAVLQIQLGPSVEGHPENILHLPFVVTPGGVSAALKGAELASKGAKAVIGTAPSPPLQFEIRASWLDSEGKHRVDFRVVNGTKNGIYIESIHVKREYKEKIEIDPNRTTKPTVWSGSDGVPAMPGQFSAPMECPMLLLPGSPGRLQISFPSVEKRKMKSEAALIAVDFTDVGKAESETVHFPVRLRWQGL